MSYLCAVPGLVATFQLPMPRCFAVWLPVLITSPRFPTYETRGDHGSKASLVVGSPARDCAMLQVIWRRGGVRHAPARHPAQPGRAILAGAQPGARRQALADATQVGPGPATRCLGAGRSRRSRLQTRGHSHRRYAEAAASPAAAARQSPLAQTATRSKSAPLAAAEKDQILERAGGRSAFRPVLAHAQSRRHGFGGR